MEDSNKEPAKQRIADDLCYGAASIAKELGTTRRQVYHLAATERVPIGRWGKTLIAFRSELRRSLAKKLTAA
jgi:hypothetical protein